MNLVISFLLLAVLPSADLHPFRLLPRVSQWCF